jgi:hypothetical protein
MSQGGVSVPLNGVIMKKDARNEAGRGSGIHLQRILWTRLKDPSIMEVNLDTQASML